MEVNWWPDFKFPPINLLNVWRDFMTNPVDNFHPGQRVIYIPPHADGIPDHPDIEYGRVKRTNDSFVFVNFDKNTGDIASACYPEHLVAEHAEDL